MKKTGIIVFFLLIVISACTKSNSSIDGGNSSVTSVVQNSTPIPTQNPTPTVIPLLPGGYRSDQLGVDFTSIKDSKILFTSLDGTINYEIQVDNSKVIDSSGIIYSWSPDKKWLVFSKAYGCTQDCYIHFVDVINKVDHPVNLGGAYFSSDQPNIEFSWNTSSSSILTVIPGELTNEMIPNYEIVKINIADFSIEPTGFFGHAPRFAPTSDDISFVKFELPFKEYFVARNGAAEPQLVVKETLGGEFSISDISYIWNKNGDGLFYCSDHEIRSVDLIGSEPTVIVHMDNQFSINPGDLSNDGNYLALAYGTKKTTWQPGFVNLQTSQVIILSEPGTLFWTPDNHALLANLTEKGIREYSFVDLEDGSLTLIDLPQNLISSFR